MVGQNAAVRSRSTELLAAEKPQFLSLEAQLRQ
jgi:hypothetical protein